MRGYRKTPIAWMITDETISRMMKDRATCVPDVFGSAHEKFIHGNPEEERKDGDKPGQEPLAIGVRYRRFPQPEKAVYQDFQDDYRAKHNKDLPDPFIREGIQFQVPENRQDQHRGKDEQSHVGSNQQPGKIPDAVERPKEKKSRFCL